MKDHDSPPEGQAPLPADIHTERQLTPFDPSPPPTVRPAPRLSPAFADRRSSFRSDRTVRVAILCLVLFLSIAGVLVPAVGYAWSLGSGMPPAALMGRFFGEWLLRSALPPTGQSVFAGLWAWDREEDTTLSPENTTDAIEPQETDTAAGETSTAETTAADTTATDTRADDTTAAESEIEVTEPPFTPRPDPDGCFPIAAEDRSEPERGVDYIINTAGVLPGERPDGRLWNTAAAPAVLIVNTHPYEGYSDRIDFYDPATGGLSQTDSPHDPDGVVALGAGLARNLRSRGVTVIHLRVSVASGEGAGEIYDRTEELIRHYLRLYPDIGLVIDLRRSAELTGDGEILRTTGTYKESLCAQARISVSADRSTEATARDLAVARALRQNLWRIEPSLSRPVWVKGGQGLIADQGEIAVLTVELGSAGNTYAEAQMLIQPIGEAIARLTQK